MSSQFKTASQIYIEANTQKTGWNTKWFSESIVREAIEKHAEHTHAEGYINKYCHWCKLIQEFGLDGEQK
jgi:hypothetical protein